MRQPPQNHAPTTERADQLLVTRALARSRSQATRWVRDGQVEYRDAGEWRQLSKAAQRLAADVELRVTATAADRFVSRGGAKLEAALDRADIPVTNSLCLDIGISTGGFSDCLLQRGAARIVGVDVGHGQLAPGLAANPRVTAFDGINARRLPAEQLAHHAPDGFDLIVMDVSFISQTLVIKHLPPLLAPRGRLVSLVKPQFELDRAAIGKGGIVTDSTHYARVRRRIVTALRTAGLRPLAYFPSAITGGDGNREFFVIADAAT